MYFHHRFLAHTLTPLLLVLGLTALLTPANVFASEPPTTDAKASQAADTQKDLEGISYSEIPFRYDPPGRFLITVQARVNGSEPMTFLLDTGWSPTFYLLPWAAKKLDLKLTGKEEKLNPGNQKIELAGSCLVELIGTAGSKNAKITIENTYVGDIPNLEKLSSTRVAGIIGGQFFTAWTTRFDFDRKTLTLIIQKHPPLPLRPDSLTIPLSKDVELPCVQATPGEGSPITFLVDTGSNGTQIPADIAGKQKLVPVATSRTLNTDIEKTVGVDDILLPQLEMGGRKEPLVSVVAKPGLGQAILGTDFLSRFRFTLDKPNGIMTLEPRLNYERRLLGDTGLLIDGHDGNFLVVEVSKSVPEIQKLSDGDRLISVDGQSVAGLAQGEASLMLGGYEGVPATIVVEKPKGDRVTIKLLRRSNYATVVRSPLGLLLVKDNGQFARVIQVDPGSEAEKAGITENQFVTRVGNKSTQEMSPETLIKELQTATATAKTLKVEKSTVKVK